MNILSYLLGGIDTPLIVLFIIMIYVYLTRWCRVIYCHKWTKLVGLKGIIRDIGYLVIISLSSFLDQIMGDSEAIRIIVIYFFIAHEGLVILKNLCTMGLPLPKKIYDTLENLVGDEEEMASNIKECEENTK